MTALGKAAQGRADRAERLRRSIGDHYVQEAADHGCPLSAERVRELLAPDVELNAQGLEVWLDKA